MKITIDRTQRNYLNSLKITSIEYSVFDEKYKVWLSGKTWINGHFKRISTIEKKLSDLIAQNQADANAVAE